MKRTLIAAALSTLFVGAVHAEYSIYGLLDASIGKSIPDDMTDKRVNFHSGGDSDSGQGNSTTRIGVKGSTDVGSGIKMNFKLETGGIGADGAITSAVLFNRQAWLGASGSFGEVRFGRQDSVPFQALIDYDYNGFSNGVTAIGYAGVPWAAGRQSRSLQYISPTVGGLKGQLGLQLKDSDRTVTNSKDVVSGALTYTAGGLSGSVAFQSKDVSGGNNYFGAAVGYDFGMAKVSVGYHDVKDVKGISLAAQTTVAGFNLGAIYATQTTDKTDDAKGQAIELYVNKEVLKNTYAYFELGNADTKVAGAKKGTGYALGVIYVF
ncbi:Outer membrane protein (Porin) [Rubrivivax sp. A210]|uniref:porin n=1 Tax=Rubrivivax sp. A210 TaxID=2772301 RepID=UPI001918612F|nr:porin [Rubrivivax sp. A210]CAD5374579.1 Outer membrane protein (Porin) [Rubrivivax sp. A210]